MQTKVWIDGGYRHKIGKAAYGYILKFDNNAIIWDCGVFEGKTSNEAEYTALIKCVEKAIELGCYHLEIYSDSKLIVNQVNEIWNCNYKHLDLLRKEALSLLKEIDYWTLNWIPRSDNVEADWIVNYAFGENNYD